MPFLVGAFFENVKDILVFVEGSLYTFGLGVSSKCLCITKSLTLGAMPKDEALMLALFLLLKMGMK